MNARLIGSGVAFLVIFLTGFALANSEKPLNSLLLNVHKLIGLGVLILLVVTVLQSRQITPLDTTLVAVTMAAVLLFLVTIVTGGLLSIEAEMPRFVHIIHLVLPFLTVALTAYTLFSLRNPTL